MELSRDVWYEHLVHGTGPLDPDAVESLAPTPELLKLLRESAALPWDEFDEPERQPENDAPFFSMLLLGLLRDEASVGSLLELAAHAIEEDWDAVIEVGPPVFGAIGPAAIPPLLAELDRLEREENIDSIAIDRDDLDDSGLYRYWQLVIALEQIALSHPETREEIARFAAERIATHKYDRPPAKGRATKKSKRAAADDDEEFLLPTPTEIWVDLQLSLRIPELAPLVEDFFDRHGPAFRSEIFGTRELFDEVMADDPPVGSARARLLQTYRDLHDPDFMADDDDDDFDDEPEIETVVRSDPKVGRNDPCPCGSGRKYKKCHGA